MYSMPAHNGAALNGLSFKGGEPLQPALNLVHRAALVGDAQRRLSVELAPLRECSLWKAGDDLTDLEALHAFRTDLFNNFANLQAAFDAFDSQKIGSLTLSEFQWGCRAIAFEDDSKRIFLKMDTENVGRIHVDSFLELKTLPSVPKSHQERTARLETDGSRESAMLKDFATQVVDAFGTLEEGFERFDSSGNSSGLSHSDLQRLVQEIGLRGDTKPLFSRIDTSKDGRISRHEFLALKSLIKAGLYVEIPPQPMLWRSGDDTTSLDLLRDFVAVLYESFQDLEDAFDAFDVSRVGRLTISNFQWGARSVGFKGDAKKLFVLMDAEKTGAVTREEFFSLDRLPMTSGPDEEAEDEEEGDEQIIVLMHAPEHPDHHWPHPILKSVFDATQLWKGHLAEARFAGCSEELASLLREDARRNQELFEEGEEAAAEKNRIAAVEAAKAVEDDIDLQLKFDFPQSLSRIQGTTSIDARVVTKSSVERGMFVQTAVIDRTGSGSHAADDAALVLELRDRQCRSGASSTLRAQIDTSKILSINQTSPGSFSESILRKDVSFTVTFTPDALIVGAVPGDHSAGDKLAAQAGSADFLGDAQALFHRSDDGRALQLHVVVGPSAWRRRDGIRFFDELRILMHFVADGVTAAATSIGAAAGAAARNARSGPRVMA